MIFCKFTTNSSLRSSFFSSNPLVALLATQRKLTVALSLLASAAASNLKAPEHYEKLFGQWMSDFSMTFDEAEYQERLQIFSDADDTINLHNAKNSTFTMGHNEYSHLTWEEVRSLSFSQCYSVLTRPFFLFLNYSTVPRAQGHRTTPSSQAHPPRTLYQREQQAHRDWPPSLRRQLVVGR